MHWQVEAWKCAHPKPTSTGVSSVSGTGSMTKNTSKRLVVSKTKNECGKVFYRREQFQAHLASDHNITDDARIKEQCKLRRIGRNGHNGFWCGFCQTVIMLEKKNNEAFDERFTHIDSQHFDKGERVETWFPMEGELPKGLLSAPAERSDKEEEFEGPVSDVADGENSGSDPEDDLEMTSEELFQQSTHLHAQSQKRPSTTQTSAVTHHREKEKKTVRFWVCVGSLFSFISILPLYRNKTFADEAIVQMRRHWWSLKRLLWGKLLPQTMFRMRNRVSCAVGATLMMTKLCYGLWEVSALLQKVSG